MTEIVKEPNRTTVKPGKNIVASVVPAFRKEIASLLVDQPKELVVDLADVEMIDSEGMGVLIWAHHSLKKTGGELIVTNVYGYTYDVLKALELDKVFTVLRG